jgi:hypothetical protein
MGGLMTWDNQSPSKSIARIDYQSMNTASAPFCIALSGELMPEHENQTQAPVVAGRLRESVGLSGPLVMDDMVVVGDDQGLLRALQTKDGREVWTHKHEGRIYDAPVFDSEHVYFSSDRGVVGASRAEGKMHWNHPIAEGAGPCLPLEPKGLVFAGGNDGFIYAFDAKKGVIQWKTNVADDAPPDPPGFPRRRARTGDAVTRPTGVTCDGDVLYPSLFNLWLQRSYANCENLNHSAPPDSLAGTFGRTSAGDDAAPLPKESKNRP